MRVALELGANLVLLALFQTYISFRLAIFETTPRVSGIPVELLAAPLVVLALVRILFAVLDEWEPLIFRRVASRTDVSEARNELRPYREDVVLRKCDLQDCEITSDATCVYCGRSICEEHRDGHARQEREKTSRPLNTIYLVLSVMVFVIGFIISMDNSGYPWSHDLTYMGEEKIVIQAALALVGVAGLVYAGTHKDRVELAVSRIVPLAGRKRWPLESMVILLAAITGLLVYSTAFRIIFHANSLFH